MPRFLLRKEGAGKGTWRYRFKWYTFIRREEMAEYMITRASIINRCNSDGQEHSLFTEKERPCKEAVLKDVKDNEGKTCSRYFIELDSIEDVDRIGIQYDVDILVTRNLAFDNIIALVLYDEEINQQLY